MSHPTTSFRPMSARSIRADVVSREVSAVEIARESLRRAESANPALNAFLQLLPDQALAQAAEIDRKVAAGAADGLPLAGVPVAIKDNICLSWGRTTCASKFLAEYESPFTATAAQRLVDAGAVIIGKTNLDEFAMGSSGENSAFGPTRNPHDHTRVPGGSSSGSAAAVGAGIVPVALGSDTGGSIRQPAALCGCVGLKPTYGRVSRYGLVAFASSLDQIGPITHTADDAAMVMNVLCGRDPLDATSSPHRVTDFAQELAVPIPDLVIAVPKQSRSEANHPAVNAALDHTVDRLRKLGARIIEADLTMSDAAIAAYYLIATAEASSNLARFDGIRYGRRAVAAVDAESLADSYRRSRSEGFGPEVQRRIMLGTHVLSSGYYDAYYNTALKARRRILNDYNAALARGAHAILTPATPGPAFRLGEKTADALTMYLEDVYTVGVNLAGLPALSFPVDEAPIGDARLPIGMQLVGAAFDERTLLRIVAMLGR